MHSVQLRHHETFSNKFNAGQSRLRKRNTLTFYSSFVILSFIYIRYFRFMSSRVFLISPAAVRVYFRCINNNISTVLLIALDWYPCFAREVNKIQNDIPTYNLFDMVYKRISFKSLSNEISDVK